MKYSTKSKEELLQEIIELKQQFAESRIIENKLTESEIKFKTLTTTATDGIIILNEKAETTFWNNAATKIFGFTSKEALGKDLHTMIVPVRYYEDYKKGFAKFVKTGKGSLIGNTREVTAQRKDGTEFPMEISMSVFKRGGKWNSVGIIRDITERKQEEEKYRILFELSTDALSVFSEEGFIDCNQSTLDIFEITSKEDFLSTHLWELSPSRQPDGKNSKEKAKLMIEQAFQKGSNRFEWTHRRKNGKSFPAEVLLTKVVIAGKEVIQATVTDITNRRLAEIKLLEQQSLNYKIQSALLEIAQEKINKNFNLHNFTNKILKTTYNIFKQDRLSFWLPNEKGFYLSGYIGNSENPEGINSLLYIEFPNYLKFMGENRLLISNDVTFDERLSELKEYFTVTGTHSMLDASAVIDDKVVAIICFERLSIHEWSTEEIAFMRGLSDQYIQTHLRLEEHKSQINQETIAKELQQFIETANAPIFGIDANGNVNEWNKTTEKITGFSKEEAIGKDVVDAFVTDEYKQSVTKVLNNALIGKETSNYEFSLYTNNKQHVMILLNATTRRDLEGNIIGVVGIGQDITELVAFRNELETKIKIRTKKLNESLIREKELSELKSRFVSMASHEFRTPLSAINFAAGSVKKYWEKLDADSRIQKLEKIENQVKHMTSLLDDILIIGKAEVGKITSNIQLYNFNEFIQPIIEEVYTFSNKTHEIILINKNADTTIRIDEKLGRNIFINLLNNAIKFSPGKKEVIIEVNSDNKMTQIKITDFGYGIKKEDFENIFIPFQRGENVESIQGSGLGLSIVKEAIKLSNGEIKVESTIDKGTTFIIYLLKK